MTRALASGLPAVINVETRLAEADHVTQIPRLWSPGRGERRIDPGSR